jgi:cyanophycin synthetase
MDLESTRVLRGPNKWSSCTVIEALVDVSGAQATADDVRLLGDQLCAAARTRIHSRVVGTRLDASQSQMVAPLVADLALGIEQTIGCDVGLCQAHESNKPNTFRILVEYDEESIGIEALKLALDFIAGCKPSAVFSAAIASLNSRYQDVRLGPSTRAMVEAARARNIPVKRLNEGNLVQLGHGKFQHRIWASETDQTSAIGEAIAQDKLLTKSILAPCGVPVPEGQVVDSAAEAWQAAQAIGAPVVIKPKNGNQGRGVSVNLVTEQAIHAAFDAARREGDIIIIERYVTGLDYRFLVVKDQLVAAARRQAPSVVGDGRHTIAELVAEANLDPRRGEDHATVLSKLKLDEIARDVLREQQLTPDSVPQPGQLVVLRRNANLSTGGSATDVTDEVAPEVAARVVEAALLVGLDIAGIDVVAPCVNRPLEQTGGAIVEVNAAPGLRMHIAPSQGKPRPVGEAIVASLFEPGSNGRVPIVAVTGTNGKTTTVRCMGHILRGLGLKVGLTCTDGIYLDDRRVDTGDCSGPRSARVVLSHPQVEAAVLETARGGILREGLGFDQCDVAIVTNIAKGDHLGMGGIETEQQLADVKETIVRAVAKSGSAVLKAGDPLVAAMASHCPGNVVFFDRDGDHPVMVAHRRRGGCTVFVRDRQIVVALGQQQWAIAAVDRLPLTYGGRIGFQIDNLLAVTAAAWALQVPRDVIRGGLETFSSDVSTVPGRFNLFETAGRTVISDYGHNASALLALVDAIRRMPHKHRSIVYTAAGDRRDIDIIEQAKIIGTHFDEVYLYEDKCTRGRRDGEVIRLMRHGLGDTMRAKRIHETRGERTAIESALERLERGDLLLCQVDQVEDALGWIEKKLTALQAQWTSRAAGARIAGYSASDLLSLVFRT